MYANSETHIRVLFELTGEMLCVANLEGDVLLLNPAWERIVGYTPAEIMARPFIEHIHPDDVEAFRSGFHALRNGQILRGLTARFEHRDGSYRSLHWEAAPEGNHVYALARDVTAEVAAADRARSYRTALHRNAAALGAPLAHATAMLNDLRSLQTSIVASLEATSPQDDPGRDAPRNAG